MEVMLEHKHQSEIQAELIRKQEELDRKMQKHHEESSIQQVELAKEQEEMAKKQDQANVGIASLLDMMKKQQQP
jgi:hypothetical protein